MEVTKFVASKDQVSADVMGESVILDTRTGFYYGLNPVGARVWDIIQNPMTLDEICNILISEYDVSRDICEHEVQSLLQRLKDAGLIENSK